MIKHMKNTNKILIMLMILSVIMSGCQTSEKNITQNLSGENWQFQQKDSALSGPATVPGSIHMDLLRNEMIPDPYYRNNEKDLQWIGGKDWIYTSEFNVSDSILSKENIELVFKGLDTYAQVYLNDSLILTADNFFREWKVDAQALLKKEGNTMRIVFQSPTAIDSQKKKDSKIPLFDNFVYTRKPAYHYGWDWGPVFLTAGIWKPIEINAWDDAKINDVHIVQKSISDDKAELNLVYEIEANKAISIDLNIECVTNSTQINQTAQLIKGINRIEVPFSIEQPKKWWPNGLGEAFLYRFNTGLLVHGVTVDEAEAKTGIRTIKLVQEPDSLGKSFYFEVNGVPVFAKGANYIPQDLFLNRPTAKDYEYVIDQAVAANMNMLRVWGGGFYENDIFYDLCDENGLLVWQDFMFACSMYPGDEHFMENVKQEAVQNVKRLRNHPSIALWCGNNENYIGWKDWRWSEQYSKQDSTQLWTDYLNLYEKMLPEIIQELDPEIAYWPSSPLFGWGYPVNTEGDVHYWGIWHAQEPFENFQKTENIGRFMSEYGFQGCPEMSTVKKFTLPEDREITSEVMLAHQKHRIGYPVIDKYFDWYYKQPKDFEAYLYVSQVQQAMGMGIAFEAHRRAMPHCMGTLYWQINDCYPVTSWASIDSYGNWKALHYKARQLYQTFMVSPFVEDHQLNIYVVSDKLKDQKASLSLKLYNFSGKLLKEEKKALLVKANASGIYYTEAVKSFLKKYSKKDVVLRVKLESENQLLAENDFFFVHSKDLHLKKGSIKMTSKKTEKGYEITLTATTFSKDVQLSTEDGAGFFTNNFFNLIPGIPVTVELEIEKESFDVAKDVKVYSLRDSYK